MAKKKLFPEGSNEKDTENISMEKQKEFDQAMQTCISFDLNQVAPTEVKQSILTTKECFQIVENLADTHGLTFPLAITAIFLLFLKGSANAGTPDTTTVSVKDQDSNPVEITKYDLLYSYKRVTGNKYLRRMAESMASDIGKFAEKNGLAGDIAVKINNRVLADKEEKNRIPLSGKERAWANSFSQSIPNLSEMASPRLVQLLAADYQDRYSTKKKSSSKSSASSIAISKEDKAKTKATPKGRKAEDNKTPIKKPQ